MGVPGFFVWLLKNNIQENIILKTLDNVDNLYFDANCLFHPKCFDILKLYSDLSDTNKLEDLMIDRILRYIQYIIDFVKPLKNIYISVDGVAPVAKINQQRKRRYKSVVEKEYMNKINKKHNTKKNTHWSNIVITPGTDFMRKLDLKITDYCKKNKKIIYSSYKECGEGEHKIIRDIKRNTTKKMVNVIYGLDADLIFLSMSAHSEINEIYLLRESQHLKNTEQKISDDVREPLCYLSIQNVIDTYNEYIMRKLRENCDFTSIDLNIKYDFSKDFILLCFMLGNDFIPNIPSVNIRINGIEYITQAYCKMFEYTGMYIYDKINKRINWNSLKIIYRNVGDLEDEYFNYSYPDYKRKIRNRKCNATTDYEIELWNHENLKDIYIDDKIQLGCGSRDEYKFRYYEYNFNSRINQKEFVGKICKNYLETVEWIYKYYFEIDMPSWQHYYSFTCSPFTSDLCDYLDNNTVETDSKYKEAIDINTQLISVIPYQYSDILKKCGVNIEKFDSIETKYMFPTAFELEYQNKDQYWTCEPKLPVVDFDLI